MSNPEPVVFATNRGHAMQWFTIGQYDNNNMNTKLGQWLLDVNDGGTLSQHLSLLTTAVYRGESNLL